VRIISTRHSAFAATMILAAQGLTAKIAPVVSTPAAVEVPPMVKAALSEHGAEEIIFSTRPMAMTAIGMPDCLYRLACRRTGRRDFPQ
jgi:hypothetical protein